MRLSAHEIALAVGGRVIAGSPDAAATHIATDSGQVEPGSLFVPVIGRRVDGHSFISEAMSAGAAMSFSSEGVTEGAEGLTLIGVSDTVSALQALGTYYRRRYVPIPLIGVTGSVAKTTTREMTRAALSASFCTYATPANHNSQVGVPITVCMTPPEAQIGVIELGVSEIGEMERIAAVARPDSAIVTGIGESHIAQFGSLSVTAREKLRIADYIGDGLLLIPHEDELLMSMEAHVRRESFGLLDGADYRAINVCVTGICSEYDFVAHGAVRAHVRLSVPGEHMVVDSLAAMAMALEYGVDPQAASESLSRFHGVGGRFEVRDIGDIRIINDAYNASPESMREGLKALSLMSDGRRVAVLSDMLELGEKEKDYHRELGRFIGERCDIDALLLCGKLAGCIAEGLGETYRAGDISISICNDMDELRLGLSDYIRPCDKVYFKGSHSTGLYKIAEELCSTPMC